MEGLDACINSAIAYIESNLTQELSVEEIAKRACLSPFYFQRVFAAICDVRLGEYIRNRRLSLAGEELIQSDARIIDIALKYGYDSPDSFNRAFQRFHGISPHAARKTGAVLRAYKPLDMILRMEENISMEYFIVKKPQFTLMCITREFNTETGYQEIPKFWDEVMASGNCPLQGKYGVCIDSQAKSTMFDYMIADDYIPSEELPAECTAIVIPASDWAVFPCRGPVPQALQQVNTKVWSEWLPKNKQYCLSMNLNIEMYAPGADRPEDSYCEIWLPVKTI